jgi:L-Ala-D/L-Glu epimerase
MARLRVRTRTFPTKRPFTIATGTLTRITGAHVALAQGKRVGRGEAQPSFRVCGETLPSVQAFLGAARPLVEGVPPADWRSTLAALDAMAPGNPAAKAALDMAVLDLAGQAARKPVHALLGLRRRAMPTSATVVLDAPEAMAAEAVAHAEQGFAHLKLKLGQAGRDAARLRAVRDAVPGARLRCDANTGWTEAQALRLLPALEKAEVEVLEQPVPRPFRAELGRIARAAELPVLADEAVLGLEDAQRLAEGRWADGFVLKLMKCGGLWQAKQMLALARREGLQVMVGCMVESSVGITAAAHLLGAPALRWADLDGAWLLARDPFRGAAIVDATIQPPERPGLGVAESASGARSAPGHAK